MAHIARSENGKSWRASVARHGVRKTGTFQTKAQAEAWARRIETELFSAKAAGLNLTTNRITLTLLIDRYIREMRPVQKWGHSKDACLIRLQNRLGKHRVEDLSPQHVVAYALERRGEGVRDATIEQDVIFLGQVLAVARGAWGFAVASSFTQDVRAALKPLAWQPKSRQAGREATEAELDRVKACWSSAVPVAIIDFAVDSAMRLGEITGLLWADLDGSTIVVRDRKHPLQKSGNDMRVPLLGRCPAIVAAQPRYSDRVFPFPADTVGTAWQRACKAAGVTGLRFHDLRHTGATRLFRAGYDIPQVALVTGHRDWTMLKRYTHVRAEDLLVA
jgi:integrase